MSMEHAFIPPRMPEPAFISDEDQMMDVPVTIHVDFAPWKFVVRDIGAWRYEPHGIFAQGHWEDQGPAKTELLLYRRIQHIEYDFAAYEAFKTAEAIGEVIPLRGV